MRRVSIVFLFLFVFLASLLPAACGGDGDGKGDLANGKVFDQAELESCLRSDGFRIEPRNTETGIDFTARSRSGLITTDIAVEKSPDEAKTREDAWKDLAAGAGVEDIDDYYFRYGNVLIGYERVPSKRDQAPLERCLTVGERAVGVSSAARPTCRPVPASRRDRSANSRREPSERAACVREVCEPEASSPSSRARRTRAPCGSWSAARR